MSLPRSTPLSIQSNSHFLDFVLQPNWRCLQTTSIDRPACIKLWGLVIWIRKASRGEQHRVRCDLQKSDNKKKVWMPRGQGLGKRSRTTDSEKARTSTVKELKSHEGNQKPIHKMKRTPLWINLGVDHQCVKKKATNALVRFTELVSKSV